MFKRLILILTGLLLFSTTAFSDVIYVTLPSMTIQQGINLASYGDTVLVADGLYTDYQNRDLSFHGKSIIVVSENGPLSTIIDCGGYEYDMHRGFDFSSGEDSTSILDGFTIMNGWTARGSGIHCQYNSSPTIRNCVFQYNHAASAGGAVYTKGVSSPTFIDCQFIANSAGNYGGVLYGYTGDISFIECIFSGNSVNEYNYPITPQGGAIYCNGVDLTLTGCLFYENEIPDLGGGGQGGALYSMSSPTQLTNCTIVDNSADTGGGIFFDEPIPKSVAGNGNKEDVPMVEKCIVAFNEGGEVILGDVVFYYYTPDISCTDIYGFSDENWPWPMNDLDTCCDNFSLDPKFCDTALNNYELGTNSPCTPSNASCGLFGGVQIGALGVGCGLVFLCGDVNDDNQINIFDIIYLISYLYLGGPDPIPDKMVGDIDGNDELEIFDITYLISYLYLDGPDPVCQEL